jgi:hypothetical protein
MSEKFNVFLDLFINNKNYNKIKKKDLIRYFFLIKRNENFENSQKKIKTIKKCKEFQEKYYELGKNCLDNDLICPICMDYFIQPKSGICGHNFCEQCFFESLLKFNFCPICKKSLKRNAKCFSSAFNNLIQKYINSLSLDSQKNYKKRIEKYKVWKKSQKVENLIIGDKLDVKDTENVWCVGEVKEIIKNGKNKDILFIHYIGWNNSFDEYIFQSSNRLAPFGLYTNRNDIPKYNFNDTTENRIFTYIVWDHNFFLTRNNHVIQGIQIENNNHHRQNSDNDTN